MLWFVLEVPTGSPKLNSCRFYIGIYLELVDIGQFCLKDIREAVFNSQLSRACSGVGLSELSSQ